jgi:hypothetical protein
MPIQQELTASDLYHQLVNVIDRATAEKNIFAVTAAADVAGMAGGQTHKGLSERWSYSYTDSVGQTVDLHCRWYDQSQAFAPAPDMHKMSVELRGAERLMSHSAEYEE